MLDISWINAQIALGRAPDEEDISLLKEQGVAAVIDLRAEASDNKQLLENSGIRFLHAPVEDGYPPTIELVEEVFDFVKPLLDNGKKIYLHCQNAYGRSPLLAAALLGKSGMKIAQALNLVREKHRQTSLSQSQQDFISNRLQGREGAREKQGEGF